MGDSSAQGEAEGRSGIQAAREEPAQTEPGLGADGSLSSLNPRIL